MLNVYYAPWCPHSQKTQKFLEENGVEFNPINVENQPDDVLKKVIEVNGGENLVVPTLEYKDQWRPGKVFAAEELRIDLQKMGVID